MIPTFQNRREKDGDCFRAALASILEVALRDLPDLPYEEGTWGIWDALLAERFGLWLLWPDAEGLGIRGYAVAVVDSEHFGRASHVVVTLDGEVVHDPDPEAKLGAKLGAYRLRSYGVFCCLNPVRVGPMGESSVGSHSLYSL